MAIVKVGTYRNPPEDITDYEAIVSHLEAYTRQVGNQGMILTEWTNTTNAPKIAMGSYISHGGVLYVVEDEDYALPALSSDGTYYIRVAVSGETLAVSYTTNIADYAWNAQYNSLYHPDESQVLPYQVAKNASAIEKYKMLNPWQVDDFAVVDYLGRYHGRELHVTGAISGASVNTGDGAIKLYSMGVENISLTATSGDSSVTIADMVIGKEVLLNMELTAANNYDAQVYLPPTGKYVYSGSVYNGGARIVDYSMTTQSTVTRMGLVRRIE